MKNHIKILLGVLSLGVPLWTAAQTTLSEPAAASSPAQASDPTRVELNYQSAFADYKPYQDIKPGDWRAANDAVSKAAGGHSGSGMSMAAQPSSAAPASPHTGHKMGGGEK